MEGIVCGHSSDHGTNGPYRLFCGLFNDDAAIAEYIVPMVRGLVKWTKPVRGLAGSSSYPSI